MPVEDLLSHRLCRFVLERERHGEEVLHVQVTALDPRPIQYQSDLFEAPDAGRAHMNRVVEAINARYGELTLAPAMLLKRSRQPKVIAPAWKPTGPPQTV